MTVQKAGRLKTSITLIVLSTMLLNESYAFSPSTVKQSSNQSPINLKEQVRIIQDIYFTYDINGNILTKSVDGKKTTYTYNAIDQLINIQKPDKSNISFQNDYDALGNLERDQNGNHYRYNLLNQLVQFHNQHTSIQAHYQYYANHLRAQKTVVSSPTVAPIYYYYDAAKNANIVNERQGQLDASYLLPKAHIVRYLNNDQGDLQKQIAIHGAKDVEAIANDQGNINKAYHYSPNGIVQPMNPAIQISSVINPPVLDFSIKRNPFQYSGQYRDIESGLDYLRARYYNPSVQRFIQRDSYQLLNRYSYAKGNPIQNIDPSGHTVERKPTLDIIIGVLAGMGLGYLAIKGVSWWRGRLTNKEEWGNNYKLKNSSFSDEEITYRGLMRRNRRGELVPHASLGAMMSSGRNKAGEQYFVKHEGLFKKGVPSGEGTRYFYKDKDYKIQYGHITGEWDGFSFVKNATKTNYSTDPQYLLPARSEGTYRAPKGQNRLDDFQNTACRYRQTISDSGKRIFREIDKNSPGPWQSYTRSYLPQTLDDSNLKKYQGYGF